jgi:hypothetical protein
MDERTIIPYDQVAEDSLIGAMLLNNGAVIVAMDIVRVDDFYNPLNARVFGAAAFLFEKKSPIDAVTISSYLNEPSIIGQLTKMIMDVPSASHASNYAEIIRKHSVARKIMLEVGRSLEGLRSGLNPYLEAERIEKLMSGIGSFTSGEPESLTLEELAARSEAIAPVIIPGMMHQDYRTIVVAEEGAGKSLLLRTIAMTASQGFHPFSHQRIAPVRVLIVDLENPTQAITQTAVPFMTHLQELSGDLFDTERLRFWRRPGGIEIRNLSDKAELQREIAFHKPNLVCIGPVYKMYRRGSGESYEDSADEAMAILDYLRMKYGFALIMEHHAAKGKPGERRELSPMGSQRWMAWPEIGISLYKDLRDPTMLHVKRYRGDRLQGVDWPDRIMRNKSWLVEGSWDRI